MPQQDPIGADAHSNLRRWIVPSFGKGGWKQRLRWIGLRVVGYYLAIVAAIGLFQCRLIYLPTRADAIQAEAIGFTPGQIHNISFATHDGLRLRGWHLLPRGMECESTGCDEQSRNAERVVLYFPSNVGNRGDRAAECRTFTDLGAHVLLFDYRGYGDNPGAPSEEDLARDAEFAWDYVVHERGAPAANVVIFGESLGGAVASRLAAELCAKQTPPAGLILCGTFSSMSDAGVFHYPWLPVRWLLIDRFPSEDRIGMVSCPILQIHGDQDEIVPLHLGRKLFAAAPEKSAGGVPKRFVEIRGAGHNDFAEHRIREPIREFMERIPIR